jgi:hypothetical protein
MPSLDPIEAHLRDLETRLLHPDIRRDPTQAAALIADDFLEIGASGRTYNKSAILELLQTEPPLPPITLSDFHARPLADNIILVTYRTTRHDASGHPSTSAKRSSIWIYRDSRWQVTFHQATPTPNP